MLGFLFPHLLVGIDMIRVTSLLIKQTFNEYIQKHQSTPMRNIICGFIKKKKKKKELYTAAHLSTLGTTWFILF